MTDLPLIAGRYQVVGVLGEGGMGEVLLARDLRLDMDVAIKRVPARLAQVPALRSALTKEAQILARLNDPRIVRLFDLSETPEGLLLVLEYVCGPSLQEVLRARQRLSEAELLQVMRDVTGGLSVAHAHGVVHRDLKPANILMAVSREDRPAFFARRTLPSDISALSCKVADFGIAKVIERGSPASTLVNAGSPGYMAPEQFLGEPPSPETDVYALGIIAYQALTGEPPFVFGDPSYYHVCVNPPPPLGCSPHASAVVLRSLAKKREDRYPSAAAFFEALAGGVETPVAAPPPQPVAPAVSSWMLTYAYAVGVLVFVLLAGALWLLWWTIHHRPDPVDSASLESSIASIGHAPYVEELPPIVERAEQRDLTRLTGPRRPRVAWQTRIAIPETIRLRVAGTGARGIIYLVAGSLHGDTLCGMRDGELVWCYDGLPSYSEFDITEDGRIWVGKSTSAAFCFNSRGQGGRVPQKLRPPPRGSDPFAITLGTMWGSGGPHLVGAGYNCSSPHGHRLENAPDRPGLLGRAWDGGDAWFLPLPHDCTEAYPAIDSRGGAYFVTVANTLYSVNPHGRVRWSAPSPCPIKKLFPVASGDLVVLCAREFARFHDGALLWKTATSYDLKTSPLMDSGETFYLMEEFNASFTHQPASHIAAIEPSGARRWDFKIEKFKVESLFLDGAGRLYVTGEVGNSTNGSWGVVCLSD